jgi:hypothetical protein
LPLALRQTHAPCEKLFVVYSGDRITVIDAQTGEIRDSRAVRRRSRRGELHVCRSDLDAAVA